MDRIWKDVLGYEGLYEVSDDGYVRNAKTGQTLAFSYTYNGYTRVTIYRRCGGKRSRQTLLVHRIVATAFIREPLPYEQVNHIDGNKTNNAVCNLEWCTPSENLAHSVRIGLRDMTCCTKATQKSVYQYSLDGQVVRKWDSMSAAARELGVQVSNISHCCAGRIKHTGGYKWSFAI